MKPFNIVAVCIIAFIAILPVKGQKYFTKSGMVSFYSNSPMEKIEGITKSANCILDVTSGALEMAVLVKSLNFQKALMQEHFNENYMESNKFPKATFKGELTNIADIKLNTAGTYTAKVKGNIMIHGVSKPIEIPVTFKSDGTKTSATTDFDLTVADFNISIPSLVKDNIAKIVKVSIKVDLEEFKKAQ